MQISGLHSPVSPAPTGGIGHAIARALPHARRQADPHRTPRRGAEPLADRARRCACARGRSGRPRRGRCGSPRGRRGATSSSPTRRCRRPGALDSFTMEEIDRALDVNLRAPIVLAHALVPAMIERGSGHLLFMSSLAGKAATPGASLYNATKFGLRGFAGGLRADLRGSGVGVSTVLPRLHPRRRHVRRRRRRSFRPVWARARPRTSPRAVVRAIERNRGEIDVAPLPCALGATCRERRSGVRARAVTPARLRGDHDARWTRASATSAEPAARERPCKRSPGAQKSAAGWPAVGVGDVGSRRLAGSVAAVARGSRRGPPRAGAPVARAACVPRRARRRLARRARS